MRHDPQPNSTRGSAVLASVCFALVGCGDDAGVSRDSGSEVSAASTSTASAATSASADDSGSQSSVGGSTAATSDSSAGQVGTETGAIPCAERDHAWSAGDVQWLEPQIDRRSEMRVTDDALPSTLLVVDPAQDQLFMFGPDGLVSTWSLAHDLTAGNLGAADMDDDGDADAAIFADGSDLIEVLRRDDDAFVPDAAWSTPHGTYGSATFAPLVGDDDVADLVAVIGDGVVAVFAALDYGDYDAPTITPVAGAYPSGDLIVTDLTADGGLDVVAHGRDVLVGTAAGLLDPRAAAYVGGYARPIRDDAAPVDLVQLSVSDLPQSSHLRLLEGDGTGAFVGAQDRPLITDCLGEPETADLDQDGFTDFIVPRLCAARGGGGAEGGIHVWFGCGDGSFIERMFPFELGGRRLEVGDLDADGVLDLVIMTVVELGGPAPAQLAIVRGAS